MLKQFIIAGLGGGIGSMLRFGINFFSRNTAFPFTTLFINISGSLLIGLFMGLVLKGNEISDNWKIFLVTGICGGFTTFSAFSFENLMLLQNGKVLPALFYILLSVTACIIFSWIGFKLTS